MKYKVYRYWDSYKDYSVFETDDKEKCFAKCKELRSINNRSIVNYYCFKVENGVEIKIN